MSRPLALRLSVLGVTTLLLTVFFGSLALGQESKELQSFRAQLESAEALERRSAAASLGALGRAARSATPALVEALADESPAVRAEAARAIGRTLGHEDQAVPGLIAACGDSAAIVRRASLLALANYSRFDRGQSRLARVLAFGLEDPDLSVRRAAARAIGRRYDCEAFVPSLLAALEDEERGIQREVLQTLRGAEWWSMPKSAQDILGRVLRGPELSLRPLAAKTIWASAARFPSGSEQALLRALDDPSSEVRYWTALIWAKGGWGSAYALPPRAIELLIDFAFGPQPPKWVEKGELWAYGERVPAGQLPRAALANLGPQAKAAVPGFVGVLGDPSLSQEERLFAIKALGKIGSRLDLALPALLSAMEDPDEGLQIAALEVLADLGSDEEVERLLEERLRSSSVRVRATAASALSLIDKGPALARLLVLLREDPAWEVRDSAALALFGFAASESAVIPALTRASQSDPRPEVRETLARLLGRVEFEDPASLERLVALARDPSHQVRVTAIRSLAYRGAHKPSLVLWPVASAARDGHEDVEVCARWVLGKLAPAARNEEGDFVAWVPLAANRHRLVGLAVFLGVWFLLARRLPRARISGAWRRWLHRGVVISVPLALTGGVVYGATREAWVQLYLPAPPKLSVLSLPETAALTAMFPCLLVGVWASLRSAPEDSSEVPALLSEGELEEPAIPSEGDPPHTSGE